MGTVTANVVFTSGLFKGINTKNGGMAAPNRGVNSWIAG